MELKFYLNWSHNVYEDRYICFISKHISTVTVFIYLLIIAVCSLSFFIICGNLLVITSVIYFKQLYTPTNFLILSLAVTDLLVGFLILPYGLIPATSYSCWIQAKFDIHLSSSSIWHLCFISIDRYYAVCQPLSYRTKINVRVIVIMIMLSWSVSAFGHSVMGLQDIVCFYLPAITTCSIYLKILTVAKRQACSIQNTTCQSTKSESKMERKATKTLAIVMGVFLICWSPCYICWTLKHSMYACTPNSVPIAFRWLGWTNSMLNPFIYGYFYSWFRSAFRMIISGKIFQGDFTHSKLS